MEKFSKEELATFKKEYAQSQTSLKSIEGLKGDSSAVSEMLVNFGYVWIDDWSKWVAKNNSSYTERDDEIVEFLRFGEEDED